MDSIFEGYLNKLSPAQTCSQTDSGCPGLKDIGSSLNDFVLLRETGRGASGVVFKAQSKLTGAIYALKRISLRHIQRQRRNAVLEEVRMLKSLRHPNILECYGSFTENEDLFIVTEYAEGGDLSKLIKRQMEKKRRIGEGEIWEIVWQIALALLHLHAHSIIHRDIKTLNILVTKDCRIKLGDLGESVLFNRAKLTDGKFPFCNSIDSGGNTAVPAAGGHQGRGLRPAGRHLGTRLCNLRAPVLCPALHRPLVRRPLPEHH